MSASTQDTNQGQIGVDLKLSEYWAARPTDAHRLRSLGGVAGVLHIYRAQCSNSFV